MTKWEIYYKYFLTYKLKLKVIKDKVWRKYEDEDNVPWVEFNIFPDLEDYIIERK